MAKAARSGITVRKADVPIILAMVARGDRRHDVAAWFGLNQGRIKEVENGKHGSPPLASSAQLPPSGSPGLKAKRLSADVRTARQLLKKQTSADTQAALKLIEQALAQYNTNE